jgi:hypothetical protein
MTVPWADDGWVRIVQPSEPAEPAPLRWRASDQPMVEPALESQHVHRSDSTYFDAPYGSMTPAQKATLERQLVRDTTGERHRRFWPFQPKGRKAQPRVTDPDERPDVEFWSRRWRSN